MYWTFGSAKASSIRTKFQVSRCVALVSIVKKLLHHCAGVLARVHVDFFAVRVVYTKQMSWEPVLAGVYVTRVLTSTYIFTTQSLQGVHMRSCMRSLFIRIGGRG